MRPTYRFCLFLAYLVFRIYFRGRAFGCENVPETGGVLLACTHQSMLDPAVTAVTVARECHFMARDTLFDYPGFGRLIAHLNAFPVRRGRADLTAVKETLRRLRDGGVVILFPEGTRSRDGSIGRVNPNSLAIAKKAGAAIVPVIIDGSFEAFPRGRRFPLPRKVHVNYAQPITVEETRDWPIDRIVEAVAQRWHETMDVSRRRRLGRRS